MFQVPDRLGPLMARIEKGEVIPPADFRRIATLQALDLVKVGDDFVREMAERDDKLTQEFITQ